MSRDRYMSRHPLGAVCDCGGPVQIPPLFGRGRSLDRYGQSSLAAMLSRALLSLLALAAATSGAPAMAAPDDGQAPAMAAIQHANADWLPAMRAKDPERLAEAYAENGVFVLADGREIVGRAAIIDFYRMRVSRIDNVVSGAIRHDGMTLARDGLIYEWGHGGATIVGKDGKTTTTDAPFLTVWKRQADGRWRILRNLVF